MVQKCLRPWFHFRRPGFDQRTPKGPVRGVGSVKMTETVEKCGKKQFAFRLSFATHKVEKTWRFFWSRQKSIRRRCGLCSRTKAFMMKGPFLRHAAICPRHIGIFFRKPNHVTMANTSVPIRSLEKNVDI